MKINEIVTEGLGYSTDPEQGKWYHEGVKAHKHGTTGSTIQDIASKHGCPPEWLDAFGAGYRDAEGWNRGGVSEARANTASTRAGLAKRKETKPLTPDEQIAKDREKFEKWKAKNQKPEKVDEASYIDGEKQDPKSLRWKQTSMSYDEAVKKYGKDCVRKEGKNRAGQEVIAVRVPLGETTSSSSIGTAMTGGKSPNVGTLFGGSYKPKTPFTAKKKAGKK